MYFRPVDTCYVRVPVLVEYRTYSTDWIWLNTEFEIYVGYSNIAFHHSSFYMPEKIRSGIITNHLISLEVTFLCSP